MASSNPIAFENIESTDNISNAAAENDYDTSAETHSAELSDENLAASADTFTFANLNLSPSILKAIAQSGYTNPTPIQAQAIPVVLSGRDLMASAQTGTGKTAAFVLPALESLVSRPTKHGKARILVLTPTRELAQQVTAAANLYGTFLNFNAVSIVGGMPYRQQFQSLSRPVDMIIATPGRFMDMIERSRSLDLSHIDTLILDEADRMLDMGFIDDVEHIAEQLEKASRTQKRQTLLFSATLDDRIAKIAKKLLDDPALVEITPQNTNHAQIEQRLYVANDLSHKERLLESILSNEAVYQAIIFSATKRHAESFATQLRHKGHKATALHGDMKQSQRNRTLAELRSGKVEILVATDVAARGIDVRGISHVVNFDLPRSPEDYVHRIGRTGRAGQAGIAISFATPSETICVRRIETYTGATLAQFTIPGLEPAYGLHQGSGASKGKGGRGRGGYGGGRSNSGGGYRSSSSGGGYSSRSNSGGGYRSEGNSSRGNAGGYRSERPVGRSDAGGFRSERPAGNGGRSNVGSFRSEGNSSRGNTGGGYRSERPAGRSDAGGYRSEGNSSRGNTGGGYRSERPAGRSDAGGYRSERPAGRSDAGGFRSERPAGNGGRSNAGGFRSEGNSSRGNTAAGGYRSERPAGNGGRSNAGGFRSDRPEGSRSRFASDTSARPARSESAGGRGRRSDSSGDAKPRSTSGSSRSATSPNGRKVHIHTK